MAWRCTKYFIQIVFFRLPWRGRTTPAARFGGYQTVTNPFTLSSRISKATWEHSVHLALFYCSGGPFLSPRWGFPFLWETPKLWSPHVCPSAKRNPGVPWFVACFCCRVNEPLTFLYEQVTALIWSSRISPRMFVSWSGICNSVVALISLQIDQKADRKSTKRSTRVAGATFASPDVKVWWTISSANFCFSSSKFLMALHSFKLVYLTLLSSIIVMEILKCRCVKVCSI